MTDKIFRYFVTTIGGLEEVVLANLQARLKTVRQIRVEKGSRHGRIFFTYAQSPRQLLNLRAADGCFAVLAELNGVTVGRPGLDYVISRLSRLDLAPALRLIDAVSPNNSRCGVDAIAGDAIRNGARRFQLGVTMSGSHRFSRSELTRSAQDILLSQGMQLSIDDGSLRFHLHLQGKRALFCLRLPVEGRTRTFAYRGRLDGPLAHCLGLLLGLGRDDAVVATGCAQAALEEIVTAGHPRLLVGLHEVNGEVFPVQLPSPVAGGCWIPTAGAWPIVSGAVDCVLGISANIESPGLNLHECARVLYPGAIAGVLSENPAEFVRFLEAKNLPFEILASVPIYLKGRKHQLLVLERLEEVSDELDLIQIDDSDQSGAAASA